MGPDGEVGGWCPLGRPPRTDDECFEALTAAVFQARFRADVVRARWPALRRALAGFRLAVVARWPDEEVERLLEEPGVVRNRKKLLATLRNARDLQRRAREHGSARAYLDSFDDAHALAQELGTWAHYIGLPSIRWFLRCIGRLPAPAEGPRAAANRASPRTRCDAAPLRPRPVALRERGPAGLRPARRARGRGSGRTMTTDTVLVVEDDPDVRATLTTVLQMEGLDVQFAECGQRALELLRRGARPILILLDLSLPRMSGRQFRDAQLADPGLAGIPVVVVSGDGRIAERAADLGVAGFLLKPVELGDLLALLQRFRQA